jgi:hypothetical protein
MCLFYFRENYLQFSKEIFFTKNALNLWPGVSPADINYLFKLCQTKAQTFDNEAMGQNKTKKVSFASNVSISKQKRLALSQLFLNQNNKVLFCLRGFYLETKNILFLLMCFCIKQRLFFVQISFYIKLKLFILIVFIGT